MAQREIEELLMELFGIEKRPGMSCGDPWPDDVIQERYASFFDSRIEDGIFVAMCTKVTQFYQVREPMELRRLISQSLASVYWLPAAAWTALQPSIELTDLPEEDA